MCFGVEEDELFFKVDVVILIDVTFVDNSYCFHNDKNMCTNQNNNFGGHCAQISSLIANKLNQTGTLDTLERNRDKKKNF